MDISGKLLSMFSGRIESQNGSPTVEIPVRELDIGQLESGHSYRIAILEPADDHSEQRTTGDGVRTGAIPPVEEGEVREVEIVDVGEQGDGLARVDRGYIVFVPDTSVGDRVTVEITDTRSNYAFAEVVEEEPITG